MYVAEMRDYPFSWEPTKLNPQGGGKKDAGVVRLLEDTDGDGKFDRSRIFADKLTWPTSVCCYNGGVFVLAPPQLVVFEGHRRRRRGRRPPDRFHGFRPRQRAGRHQQSQVEPRQSDRFCRRAATAANCVHDGKTVFSIHGQDISLDPATLRISADDGRGAIRPVLRRLGQPLRLQQQQSHRTSGLRGPLRPPQSVRGDLRRDLLDRQGGAGRSRLSPQSRPNRGAWSAPGGASPTRRCCAPSPTPSSSRSVISPRPPASRFIAETRTRAEFRGNAFIGDVGGNLVHRKTLSRDGVLIGVAGGPTRTPNSSRRPTTGFGRSISSTRPTGLLYIIDMYRETIEHPYSIPEDIKSHLDLQSGDDRGRIYRLVAPSSVRARPLKLGSLSTAELLRQLESPEAWNRETAQRLLWERQDRTAVDTLAQLVRSSSVPLGRLHALYTLNGLGALSDDLLLAALADTEPQVRAHAIRLSELRLKHSSAILKAVARLTADPDPRVRFQLALSLGEADGGAIVEPLAQLACEAAGDRLLRTAVMTSAANNAEAVALRLLADHSATRSSGDAETLADLAAIAGTQPDAARATALMKGIFATRNEPGLQLATLRGLGRGLAARGSSISALLNRAGADLVLRSAADSLFKQGSDGRE